jgi:hypothetical protein
MKVLTSQQCGTDGSAARHHALVRVDAPLDRAEQRGEFVVIGVDLDLALFEPLAQCPEVLRSSIDEPLLVDRSFAAVRAREGVKGGARTSLPLSRAARGPNGVDGT